MTIHSYEVILIAGYWRVMRDRTLVSTHTSKHSADAALKRLEKADRKECEATS